MIELSPPSRGHVTQWFAQRQLQDGQPHAGQDWAYRNNETGEVFDGAYAMADGVVAWADDTRKLGWPNPWYFNPDFDRTDDVDTSAGNAVVIKHWFGWTTYCHLEETPLDIGDQVKRGQRVGTVGATGYSSGKHLHSDLILNGADVSRAPLYGRSDPNPYLTTSITLQGATITPIEQDWLDMATKQEVTEAVMDALNWKLDDGEGGKLSLYDLLGIIKPMVHAVPRDLLDAQIPRAGEFGGNTSLRGVLAYADQKHIEALRATVTAAHADGTSADVIIKAVQEALAAGVKVEATVKVGE